MDLAAQLILGALCTLEAVDLEKLGAAVEAAWALEYLPRRLKFKETPHHREFRPVVGVDDEGWEVNNPGRVRKSKKDNPGLIEVLEGMRVQEGPQFPQGDLFIRAEDHQGFHQHWMSRIEKGKLEKKFPIPVERVVYPPPVDFRREKV